MLDKSKITVQYGEVFEEMNARWIGREGIRGNESAPAPMFRKQLNLRSKVTDAILYVSGLGQYEGFVNGEPLQERIVFAPTVSDYSKTVYYNTYHIGDRLCEGENVLAFVLGRGRYAFNTPETPWNGEKAEWIDAVKMISVLWVLYVDGSEEVFTTDQSWQVKESAIVQDCMYMGETFDARQYDFEWNKIGVGGGWEPSIFASPPSGKLKYDFSEPITITERVTPISCTKLRDNVFVYAFDRYITGWLEINIDCPKDTKVSIQYAERINEQGEVQLKQGVTRERLQRDYFISAGVPMVYRPSFSYKGFYYVQVEGVPLLTIADAVGCFIHNDIKSINTFNCSDNLVNWIHNAFRRTVLCNFHGLPTDTPVFEKHGWTADANTVAPSVMLNFNAHRFYRKWLDDFLDSQTIYGEIPPIVPTTGWGLEGTGDWDDVEGPVPAWDICYPELVYWVYWYYDDSDVLIKHYDALQKYVAYLTERAENGLYKKGLGDWLPPTGDVRHDNAISPEGSELISGAYHIRIVEFMGKIAAVLKRDIDVARYEVERKRLIELYNSTYFDKELGYYRCEKYGGFRQAPNVLALAFGIANPEGKDGIIKMLLSNLEARTFHLCTGIMSTHYLLQVLTEAGYHELAYKILTVEGYPGWDYLRQNGVQTLTESWEYDVSRSLCHYAIGAVDYWIMVCLAGVHQLAAGFKKVRIEPKLPMGVDFVEYTLETISGTIAVKAERKAGQIVKTLSASGEIEIVD